MSLRSRLWPARVPSGTAKARCPARLGVEPLEDRAVPAVFVVQSLADSGAGSLRQAVLDANAAPGADVIRFAARGTVTLTTGELAITDDLRIDGPGASRLAVSGNDASRVFNIAAGTTVEIDDLTIANGRGQFRGGGIRNAGTLTLSDSVVADNVVVGLPGDNPAVASFGGGIFNSGTLTVLQTTFARNRAVGADGVPGSSGSGGLGGAIMSLVAEGPPATTVISGCTFRDNRAEGGDAAPGVAASNALGGAVVNDNGTMVISDSVFSNNRAVGGLGGGFAAGGAINNSARFGDTTLSVSRSTLVNNAAVGGASAAGTGGIGRGGGISNFVAFRAAPGTNYSATTSVAHSTILDNRAVGGAGATGGVGQGGGMTNENGGVLTVTGSAILLNRAVGGAGEVIGGAGLGGGIFNSPAGPAGPPTLALHGTLVALNRAAGGAGATTGSGVGGGVYIAPGGFATADPWTFIFWNDASTSDDDVFGKFND